MALERFNFFTATTIFMTDLAHLFIMFMATEVCLRFFNFCLERLSYESFRVERDESRQISYI